MAENVYLQDIARQREEAEKKKEADFLAKNPTLVPVSAFEAVSDRWVGPATERDLSTVDGFADYIKIVNANKKGDRGIIEELTDFEASQVPVTGGWASAARDLQMAVIAKKLGNGQIPTDKELVDFNTFMEHGKRRENATLGSNVVDLIQGSMSFGAEITASLLLMGKGVGVATGAKAVGGRAAKTGAKKILHEAIEKAVKKESNRLLKRGVSSIGKTGIKKTASELAEAAAVNMGRQQGALRGINEVTQKWTLDLVGKHMSPKAANLLARGIGKGMELESRAIALQLLNPGNTVQSYASRKLSAALNDEDTTDATMIFKAIKDINIEYFSEFTGEVLGGIFGKMVGRIAPKMKKAMAQSAILDFIVAKYDAPTPKAARELLSSIGVGNMIEELAEERVGGFLRGLLGVDSTPGLVSAVKGMWPGGEQFMTEAIAFSVLPAGMYMANRVTGGASSKERVQYAQHMKNFADQKDKAGVSESDMMKPASDILDIIDASKKPWFSDIKWMESLFGKERRGSLRDGLQSVADVLEEKGINIVKAVDRNSDLPRSERVKAIAVAMGKLQNVTWETLTQEDAELLNLGMKDSSVIKKNLGPYRATVLTEKFLDKPGAKELTQKIGHLPVETGNVRNLIFGTYNMEQFPTSWDQMDNSQQNQLMARWGTQDRAWAKQKYEGIRTLFGTSWGKDFEIVDTLPALLVKTDKEWFATGQPVGARDLVWGQNEAGENVYARSVFAWNDGKTIGLAPSSDMSDISEDTIEAGLKQKYGDLLPEAAELYLDQLRVNLVNERDGRNPASDVDFLPQQKKEKKAAIDNMLGMLSTNNGRREIFAKAVTMNRLGYSDVSGRYSQANNIFGLLSFDDAFDSMLEDVLPRDVLNALNKSSKAFSGQEISPRGMEIRDSLLQRQAGAVKVVRTALNKAVAEYEENQAADQILVKLKEAQNVAKSDTRKKGVREDLAKRIEDLDKDITFSLAVANVSENGEVSIQFNWSNKLRALPDRIKKQQTLAQQLDKIQAPKDEAAAFVKWAEGKKGDSSELLAQYEAEVLPKLEIGVGSFKDWDEAPGAQDMESLRDYENLSVNQGQGTYKEYFIKTPFDVPGQHGSFNAPNLAGWFRAREYADGTFEIQEIQSELFQKNKKGFSEGPASKEFTAAERATLDADGDFVMSHPQVTFLNLMLKDSTWVPVFTSAITQWAKQQGFEKVRFPTGETILDIETAGRWSELHKQREGAVAGGITNRQRFADVEEARIEYERVRGQLEDERSAEGDYLAPDEFQFDSWLDYYSASPLEAIDAAIESLKTEGNLAKTAKWYETVLAGLVNRMGAKSATDAKGNTWRELPLADAGITYSADKVLVEESIKMAEDLVQRLEKRSGTLSKGMPDRWRDADNQTYSKRWDGRWDLESEWDEVESSISEEEAHAIWINLHADHTDVAVTIEEWKEANNIVYDPSEAYAAGEGFFHDIGAYNSKALELVKSIGSVVLKQSRAMRNGDLKYWQKPKNQLVISAYTSKTNPLSGDELDAKFIFMYMEQNPGETREDALIALSEVADDDLYKAAQPTRPSEESHRIVIRPSSHDIVWAAVGDAYSGKVYKQDSRASADSMITVRAAEERIEQLKRDRLLAETIKDEGQRDLTIANIDVQIYSQNSLREKALASVELVSVDVKAPAASKLSLVSHSIKNAIEGRREQYHNELGVRLRLGNFYFEEVPSEDRYIAYSESSNSWSIMAEDYSPEGNEFVRDDIAIKDGFATEKSAQDFLEEWNKSSLPKDLVNLNKRLKQAFIRVHGSLNPVSPYEQREIKRASGVMETFSSEALTDLNKIGTEIEGIAQKMSEAGRFEWAQHINEMDKSFDFETVKSEIRRLFTGKEGAVRKGRDVSGPLTVKGRIETGKGAYEDAPISVADRIIAFLEEANEKHNDRLERIEMPPERVKPAIEEGTEKKGSGTKQKEKRVFGKTLTPGDAYAEWSLKEKDSEFEPEQNLPSAEHENDFMDLIDADLIPNWLRLGAPKAMALWATMEDLYDRSNLEQIATIGLNNADSYGAWDRPDSVEQAVSQLDALKYLAGNMLDQEGVGELTSKGDKVMVGQPDYSGREERGRYRDVGETAEAGTGTDDSSGLDYEYESEERTGLISIDEIDVANGISADEANRIFGEYEPRNVYAMEELDAERPLAEQIEVIYPIGGKAAREMTNPVTGLAKKVGEKLFQVETDAAEPMSTRNAFTIVSTPSQLKSYQFGDYFIKETKTGAQYPVKRNAKQPGYTWRSRTLDVIKKPLTAGFNRSDGFNVQGVIIVLDPNIENKTSYVASRMIYAGQTGRYVDMPVKIEWKKNKQGKYFLDQNGNPAIEINERDLLAQLPLEYNTRNNFDDGASNFATFVISADRLRSLKGQRSNKLAGEIRKWMLKNRIKRLGVMEMDSIAEDFANFTAPDYHEQFQATVATALNMKTQEDAAILQREQEIAIEMLEKFERAKQIENQSVPVTTFEDMQKASQDGVYVMIGEFSGRHIGTEALWLWGNRGADTSVAGEMTPSGNVFVLPAYNIESPATERFSPNVFAAGIRALNEHAQDNPSVNYYVAINPETMAYLNEGLADIDPFFGKVAASDATGQQKFTRNDILSYFAREDLAPNVLFAQEDAKNLSISSAPAKSERYEVVSMQLKNALRSIAEKGLSSMPQIERGKIAPEVFQKWVWEAMDSQETELAEEAVDEHGNYEAERGPDGRRSFADVRGLVGMRREAEAAEERGLLSMERIPAEGTSLVEKDISRMQNAAKRRKDARVHLSFNPKYFMSVHQNTVDISLKRKTNEHFGPPKETIVRAQEEVADFNAGQEEGLDPDTASRQTAANYRAWLNGTDFKNIEQGRRKWILEQIPNLRGKILVGKDNGIYIENHAYILSNMVNTLYPTKRAKASAKVMESNLKPLVLSKIVSGGQTGADRAGLDLGKKLGLETGGYAPFGYETERGSDQSLKELGLLEVTPEQTEAYTGRNKKWGPRTELNVIESDGTVWFGSPSPGKQLTQKHASQNDKPFIDNPTAEQLNKWMRINQVKTLNVAGNRASGNRKVMDTVSNTLSEAIKLKNTISTTYSAGVVQFELGISPVGRWIVQDATGLTSVAKLKTLEGYDEAKKKGNSEAAKKLASQLITADNASGLARQEDILVPVFKGSATNNMIPLAMAGRLSELTGASVDRSIIQTNKSSHLGASAMERLITKASFAGVVEPGQNYVLVDDVLTSGSTISGLREFIESHGGHVTGIVSAGGSFSPQTGSSLRIAPEKEILDKIRANMSETQLTEILNENGIAESLEHLTASQARYIASFKSIESFTDKLNDTIERLESRIVPTEAGPENGASELKTEQVTYSLTPATMFDRITPKLYQSISDKNMWDIDDQNVQDIISWVSALKERFQNYPEMTIEEMALDNSIANPMRDEIVAELKDQLAQYRESEYFRETTMSLGLAQDFMERADIWFYGGSTGLKAAFLEQHRNMKAFMHNTGLWGNRLREAVGIDNPAIPKEDKKLVKEAARDMLRALKHRIDNPHAQIVITGREKNGFREDGSQIWKGISNLDSIDTLLSKYDVLAEKHGLLKSDLVMNEIKNRIQNERKLVNESVAGLTDKEWIAQLENYMHHSYQKRERDPSEPAVSVVASEFAAAKGRKFPTFEDAIRFGFVPSSEDAISNTLTWSKVAWKKARDKFVLNAGMIMTESDGAPVMLPVFGAESGPTLFDNDAIRKLNDNLVSWANTEFKLDLKVDVKNEPKDELMRLMTKIPKLNKRNGYQQVNVENLSGVTGIIVLQGPAENMLRYIDASRWTNNVVHSIETLNSWMKFLALSFSFFHPFALMESFVASSGLSLQNPVFHPFRTREAYKQALARLKNDPEYSAFWIRNGLEISVTSPDIDRGGTLNTQITNWMEKMNILSDKENTNVALRKVGEAANQGLTALQKLKNLWDKKVWMEYQPTLKIMIAEMEKQRQEVRLGRTLEKHELTGISQYVNFALGGVEFEKLAWTNPKVMQALHLGMFAPDWTSAAAGIAGLGTLFGVKYGDVQKDAMLMRYWPAMLALVVYGIPAALQGSMALLLGDPDEGDEIFPWNNGPDREKHIDVTPLVRVLPGYKGDPTGKRRVYIRFGKQVYEVMEGWLQKPWETLKGKTSQMVKSVAEQVTGETVNGWELGFKDKGLIGLVKGEGGFWDSRIGTQLQHFVPMSLLSYTKGQPSTVFAPASRGLSPTATIKNMSAKLDAFSDKKNDKLIKQYNLKLEDVVAEDIYWSKVNGYNADYLFKRAVAGVRSKYYAEFFYALNDNDTKEMEELAGKILRLRGQEENLVKSVRGRLTNVGKKMGEDDISAISSAFNSQ